ncbi:hypothetical protein D3C71_1490630 [compost metagenome]
MMDYSSFKDDVIALPRHSRVDSIAPYELHIPEPFTILCCALQHLCRRVQSGNPPSPGSCHSFGVNPAAAAYIQNGFIPKSYVRCKGLNPSVIRISRCIGMLIITIMKIDGHPRPPPFSYPLRLKVLAESPYLFIPVTQLLI